MYRVQITDHNPSKMHLFSRDFRVAGLLFSQPVFWGRGLLCCYSGQPCLGRVALPPVVGDGLSENRCFGAFVLWRLSLEAFHVSSESQSRRDRFQPSASEQRDHSLFFSELSRPHCLRFCPCCYKLQRPGLCAPPQRSQSCLQVGARLCPLCL